MGEKESKRERKKRERKQAKERREKEEFSCSRASSGWLHIVNGPFGRDVRTKVIEICINQKKMSFSNLLAVTRNSKRGMKNFILKLKLNRAHEGKEGIVERDESSRDHRFLAVNKVSCYCIEN